MKAGRVKIVNESSYPTEEVERLVRFGLHDLDIKGAKVVAAVWDSSGSAYHGQAGVGDTDKAIKLRRKHKASWIIQVWIGRPWRYPIEPFTRNGQLHDYQSWQEALVGVTAHEAMHVQHYYDGAYTDKTYTERRERGYARPQSQYRRIDGQRIEPKCAAWERHVLLRYREEEGTRLAATPGRLSSRDET